MTSSLSARARILKDGTMKLFASLRALFIIALNYRRIFFLLLPSYTIIKSAWDISMAALYLQTCKPALMSAIYPLFTRTQQALPLRLDFAFAPIALSNALSNRQDEIDRWV